MNTSFNPHVCLWVSCLKNFSPMVKFQPNYSKCEYFISLFWEKEVWIKQKTFLDASTDALFFFAAQANEATREHGSCVVNKAALVPPTGTALTPLRYDIISVCNIGREEAPPSQDGGFSCSARTSVSCSPCCCYFLWLILIFCSVWQRAW